MSVIDHEFHHNIAKVAVDPRGNSQVDQQTTFTVLEQNALSITRQTSQGVLDTSLGREVRPGPSYPDRV